MTPFCPDDETLARWIEGDLDEAARLRVGGHLAVCDECRRAVALSRLSLDGSPAGLKAEQERAARAIVGGGRGCPEEQRLARWIEGALDDEERAAIVRHLGECDRCRRAVTLAWISLREPVRRGDARGEEAARRAVACPDEERLARLVKGTLENGERAAVIEHLASCDDCRRVVALARITSDEPVHALTEEQVQAALRVVQARAPRPRRWVVPAGAAAAAVLVAIALFFALRGGPPAGTPPVAVEPDGKNLHVPPATAGPQHGLRNDTVVAWSVDIGKTAISPNRLLAGKPADDLANDYASGEIVDDRRLPALHRWVGVEIASPVAFSRGMLVRVRYRSKSDRLTFIVGGYRAEIPAKSNGSWVEAECLLDAATLAGTRLRPGTDIDSLYVGAPANYGLDIDFLQIRRLQE